MKRKRYSAEQIVALLNQAKMSTPVADVIRQVGIIDADGEPVAEGAYIGGRFDRAFNNSTINIRNIGAIKAAHTKPFLSK